ncbi:hypothetical protein QAD02_012726 [Eretmocerus hayati]|uniref:Uncharacterized protein n=1 Tax=Eretmocerus hayati TaxID=131215 RepID=A0ACC2P332_9HYME|nr:hypothetical protein QAD02_012726 [Eretmocerus hayati]
MALVDPLLPATRQVLRERIIKFLPVAMRNFAQFYMYRNHKEYVDWGEELKERLYEKVKNDAQCLTAISTESFIAEYELIKKSYNSVREELDKNGSLQNGNVSPEKLLIYQQISRMEVVKFF